MNMLQSILINVIILLFPIIVYLFYATYTQYTNKERRDLFLDFALISSLYLLVTFQKQWQSIQFIIFLNIPLLIAYVKKRQLIAIILSIAIIFCYYPVESQSLLLLIIQYILLYILYQYCHYKSQERIVFPVTFIIINVFFCYINLFLYHEISFLNILNTTLIIIIFAIVTYLTIYAFKRGEDIISLHISMKQLEKETQYRTSLFKITHEIKNPIAVCKSYLDMFDFDNPNHRRYIPIVKEEIQKILFLLQDFLSMNRIKIEKEMLDFTMLLEEIIEQYEPVFKDSNITFHYEIIDDEIYVEGDYNRLIQVMINIIKNAMEAKGTKPLSITLKTERKKDKLSIQVIDTGTGFDMSEFDKIKEPFYTTKKNGTGLGVSLSYEIISAHNGTISYESKVGSGTKVTITLPMVNFN